MPGSSRNEIVTRLRNAGQIVETRVHPAGTYEGWDGKDLLSHLAAYAQLVAAILGAEAETRRATDRELYGRDLSAEEVALGGLNEVNEAIRREYAALSYAQALAFWRAMHAKVLTQIARLTDVQLAAPGPTHPPQWSRPQLIGVVEALIQHYEGHMVRPPSGQEACKPS